MFAERPIKAFVVDDDRALKEDAFIELTVSDGQVDLSRFMTPGHYVVLVAQKTSESPPDTSLSRRPSLWTIMESTIDSAGGIWLQTLLLERVTLPFFTGDS